MAINKKLIHFKNFEKFNSLKLSANEENTKYTLGINGEVQDGSPDILYQSVVWIKDTQKQWTHGQLYNCSPLLDSGDGSKFLADDGSYKTVESKFIKFSSNKLLKFYCIEPVTITLNGEDTVYPANSSVSITLMDSDDWTITPTSNSSISTLESWPGTLGTFYPWLEGVTVFDSIVFDMNNEDMYTKWNQGNQGLYHVQFAQYKNCIFWSDLAYISDVAKRTNYTLYYSSELPLCYSTIPDNTFKAFYFAYNVTCDPNWSNPVYKESFAKATWATQVFSYYGLHSIGLFDMDSSRFNITLPKDCRGLMYYAPNVLNAGIFDAVNTTNFGAKSGSWRDAFGHCYQLTNLYIKNLKVNLNISWSPVNQQSMAFILENAANTNAITIWLSPHTYYGLTDANKALAAEKNITLALIDTNTSEDNRLRMLQMGGDGTRFLSDSGEYKEISIPSFEVPTKISELENDKGYLVKVVLTQAEYDALETKDPNALYVISDANETEDNNFVTEAQLESRGFLTQTDRSELKEYDDFLLGKISDLESKLTAALGRIATLESELENTLKV